MTVRAHASRTITDAIISSLEGAGLLVGDAEAPAGHGWAGVPGGSEFRGYVVVYELSGGVTDGTIGEPDNDAEQVFQLTAVGATRDQCKWVADRARQVMLTAVLTIADRTVMRVAVDMLGGTIRDDDVQPPVFFSPDRYRVHSTPS